MPTKDGGWYIPPPAESDRDPAHIDMQTRIEKDALLVYRCCTLAYKMMYGGHLTTQRQEVVERYARKAYVAAFMNLDDVRKWSGGLPLQLLASIECPQYWRASRQMVWVMGEIGKTHPIAFNLRDQLKRAINKWNDARREVAVAVFVDEQDQGGDHG